MANVDLLELNEQCVTNLFMCLENVTKYLESNQKEEINKLKQCVEGYCLIEAKHNAANEALDRAKNETDSSNIDNLQDRFKDNLNSLTNRRQDLSTRAYMTQFNKRVAQYAQRNKQNLDGSDLAITQSDDQYIDPITKKPIEIPVKNKHCGHTYDHSSIMQYINMKSKKLCPVAGCGNRIPITKNDLMTDDELRFRMTLNHHSTMAQQSVIEFDD